MDNRLRKQLARQIIGLDEQRQPEDEAFATMLGLVAAFASDHGRLPSARASVDEAPLARWLNAQRKTELEGDLCPIRQAMLADQLGAQWLIGR